MTSWDRSAVVGALVCGTLAAAAGCSGGQTRAAATPTPAADRPTPTAATSASAGPSSTAMPSSRGTAVATPAASPDGGAALAAARAALPALVATYPAGAQLSDPETSPSGPTVFVAFNPNGAAAPSGGTVDVLVWNGNGWTRRARLGNDTADPVLAAAHTPPVVQAAHLTGSADPDALVLLSGGSATFATNGVLVSDVGGSWRLVSFHHAGLDGEDTVEIGAPVLSGARITSRMNSCSPDCASGQVVQTDWHYDPVGGQMVSAAGQS